MSYVFLLFISLLVSLPLITIGQSDFLVGIPGVTTAGELNFDQYINAVYAVLISVAALIAVVKVIIAGVKYMFSDIATQKSDAKDDIRSALIGLAVILSAILLLTIINPNLTNFNLAGVSTLDQYETPPSEVLSGLAEIEQSGTVTEPIACSCTNGKTKCSGSGVDCSTAENTCEDKGGTFEQSGSRTGVCVFETELIACEKTTKGRNTVHLCNDAEKQCTDSGRDYERGWLGGRILHDGAIRCYSGTK